MRVTDNSSLTGVKSKIVEVVNHPPEAPIIHGPDHGAVNIWYTFYINNESGDPEGDQVSALWYWGDGNYSEWGNLNASHMWTKPGVYGIRAKLRDVWGAGSPWSEPFNITIVDNTPPNKPEVHGPARGKPGETYLYTFKTTDPENDDVYYYVDWGDGSNSRWLGPYDSGVQESASHS